MNDLISIIVPVYNVKEYIDTCLDTIVNQTYKNIEIILINDGSTDGSEQKCLEWGKKDNRIVYLSKRNEGLGPTRNYGIKIAHGEYLVFVDSDDWLDKMFVEKMYKAIVKNNADIVECDFYRFAVDSGIKSYNVNNEIMGKEFTMQERIIYGSTCLWKMMTHKSIWIENNIQMPALPAEDVAVYALIIALGKKICSVNEPLYYYRKNRPGSITFKKETFKKFPFAMQYLIDSFKCKDMYEKYKDIIYRQLLRWTSRYLVACLTKMSKVEYKEIERIYLNFFRENYSYRIANVVVFGSYNLTRIVNKFMNLENPYNRFQFMSIISIMSQKKFLETPRHKNPYRNYMLAREFQRSFFPILDEEKPDYIVIDFIEERHDLLNFEGCYYTKSDALSETEFSIENGKIISRLSEECQEIWKAACLDFIRELKKRFKAENVILIENYLVECYGNIEKQVKYENIDQIRKINNVLKMYYDFFAENYEGIQIIKASQEKLYFTDKKYEYGCYPWHLNELVNQSIAKKVDYFR